MSLEDGEYDIDLLTLLDLATISPISDSDSFAIRYGFIPDSMDQTKLLKLYQNDQECYLKASSSDGSDKPIIFEGIPQRHRTNGSGNMANDSYFLSFSPSESNQVQLKRLNSTIRFGKSRNVAKLQAKLASLDKASNPTLKKTQINASSVNRKTLLERSSPAVSRVHSPIPRSNSQVRAPIQRPISQNSALGQNSIPGQKPASSRSSFASKRPPTANNTPEVKKDDPIISESDFDDLENDFDFSETNATQFPIIILDDSETKPEIEPTPKATPAKLPNRPDIKPKRKVEPKKPKPKSIPQKPKANPIIYKDPDGDVDMDDDFKDLEDQLQEVLEEEQTKSPEPMGFRQNSKPTYNGDSDESDVDEFQFSGVQIEGESKKVYNGFSNAGKGSQKPMSLRDLVGAKKQDEASSSEEE